MFISGFIVERVSLRYFLSLGMLFSGVFCYMFGLAKTSDIHSFFYFFVVQALAGVFQTTGWPGVVTVMGRWYGKSKRGLIFGIWNSHTSVGNMLGTFIAAYYVDSDWSKSFIYPGFIMGIVGFILFMFLPDSPDSVGLQQEISGPLPGNREYRRISNDSDNESDIDDVTINDPSIPNEQDSNNPSLRSLRGSVNSETSHFNERTPILGSASTSSSLNRSSESAVGFMGALKIPGVVEFSLFCSFRN
jgi:OPA family glycerol-3-phosphate transporter-like MFS transporter 1/2